MFSQSANTKPGYQPTASTTALWDRPINVPIPASSISCPTTHMNACEGGEATIREWKSPTPGTESDTSAASSGAPTRCLCGNGAEDGGIYCSIDCARSDAFSSLCYKPGPASSSRHASVPLTSTPFNSINTQETPSHARWNGNINVPSSTAITPGPLSAPLPLPDWDSASHYRRVARADMRREERREERKRRRAEGSVGSASSRCTTLSTASSSRSYSSRVPELVGGGHSRNASTASTASTVMSDWTGFGGGLSRNPSTASTTSTAGRRYRGDMVEVIREDEDEEYLMSVSGHGHDGTSVRRTQVRELDDSFEHSDSAARPYPSIRNGQVRRPSNSKKRPADAMGLGKDMRDILEEIISMEKSFSVDDDEDGGLVHAATDEADAERSLPYGTSHALVSPRPRRRHGQFATLPRSAASAAPTDAQITIQKPNLLAAIFDRSHPPRTPSPAPLPSGDRKRRAPDAPGAPIRGHRNSMSVGHLLAPPSVFPSGSGISGGVHTSRGGEDERERAYPIGTQGLEGGARLHRPPSFVMGHQSSLSESHTALYLATASPEAPASRAGDTAARHVSPGMETNPKMKSRNSLTFSPEIAGPKLPIPTNLDTGSSAQVQGSKGSDACFRPPLGGFTFGTGNVNTTPSRRRPAPSPNASYASMGGWRFPSNPAFKGQGTGQTRTPPGTSPGQDLEQRRSVSTPTGMGAAHYASRCLRDNSAGSSGGRDRDSGMSLDSPGHTGRYSHDHDNDNSNGSYMAMQAELAGRAAPHLLWPPPRHLEPSLFPTSPASGSHTDRVKANGRKGYTSPPALTSGFKLGELLGSGGASSSAGSRSSRGSRGSGGSYTSHGSGMEVDEEGLAYLTK